MKKLGTVKNVIHDGTIILRTTETPTPGTKVFDPRGAEVGKVVRVFGPVSESYVSLKPKPQTDALSLIGSTLYLGPDEPVSRNRPSSGRSPGFKRSASRGRSHSSGPVKNRGVNGKWQRKEKPRKK